MKSKTLLQLGLSLTLGLGAIGMYVEGVGAAPLCPQVSGTGWSSGASCTKFGRTGYSVPTTDGSGNKIMYTWGDNPAGCAWRGDGQTSGGASVCSIVTYGVSSTTHCPFAATRVRIDFTQQNGVAGGAC